MLNPASFRTFANTLFSKTAWIATVALVASLLVVVPVGGQAANAVPIAMPSSISVGDSHSCVLVERGVQCWGSNYSGQLGVENTRSSSVAVQTIEADSGATQLSVGSYHTCAVVQGGVMCWGANWDGQVGHGILGTDETDRVAPGFVTGLGPNSGVTQVSAGDAHTCAIVSGAVMCWGKNNAGQLGTSGSGNFSETPVLAGVTGASWVDAGLSYFTAATCAVLEVDGSVWCWGSNVGGLLGLDDLPEPSPDPDSSAETLSTKEPRQISGITGALSVSVGAEFACALVAGGVKCWGANDDGQLGDGTTDNLLEETRFQTITAGSGASHISAGVGFACAVVTVGVKCWGDGNEDLPNVVADTPGTPTLVAELGVDAIAVELGGSVACALLDDSVMCWGGNYNGQLGQGEVINSTSAQSVIDLPGLTQLASGYQFTCALASGAVWCWGLNDSGQLGDQTFVSSRVPVRAIASGATAISVGYNHVCAIVAGNVKCWGNNSYGQLGIGVVTAVENFSNSWDIQASDVPVFEERSQVASESITRIAAGDAHTCAVSRVDGVASDVIRCWGSNRWGQFGNPGVREYEIVGTVVLPVGTGAWGEITALEAGDNKTCAVYQGSKTFCWGYDSPALGSYETVDDEVTTVAELPPVLSISAGDSSSCAVIDSTLLVVCWGYNYDGQLGQLDNRVDETDSDNGTLRGDSVLPVPVLGTFGASDVSVGRNFACAIVFGTVKCWGANSEAQLGNGSLSSSHTPTAVIGFSSGVTLVAAGIYHACAAVETQVKCWGSNDSEVLGSPRVPSSATPIVATHVLSAATLTEEQGANTGDGQQSSAVDPATLLKPELAKANRISVLKTGQRITLTGTNLGNVKSVMVGSKDAKILSSSGSEIVIEVPANLFGSPQVTLVSSSGIQTIDGLMQIVQPYLARSVKVSSFKGNSLTKSAALVIRKSYLRDSSVNTVSCAAVIGKGTSARVKAATIAKAVSACSTVAGYSVKFGELNIAVRTLKTPLKTPYVTVTLSRSTPSLVN